LLSKLQRFLPQHYLSSFAGLLANCKIRWLKNRLIQYFVWRYPINLAEVVNPNPYEYRCFNDFFTRALKPENRPIANGIHDLISPVDGQISQLGTITQGKIFQAKGHHFTAEELLGGDAALAKPFVNGSFLTVYLAPKDYHRVHMPIDGALTQMIYVPGSLYSVNSKTAHCTPNLFARNERVIAIFDTSIGRVAVVLVGAMIVGSIEMISTGTIMPPRSKSIQIWQLDHPIYLKRGEELGRFKLGSTVIALFEEDKVTWDPPFAATELVQFGQRLGSFKPDQW
jgi:phosphatidylserine decarboxylase